MGAMHAQLFPCYWPTQVNNCSLLITLNLRVSTGLRPLFLYVGRESFISSHNPIYLGVVEAILFS